MTFNSLYIHIPFCVHRCGYCDFNTFAGIDGLIPEYTLSICKELEFVSQTAPQVLPIYTIYFGGGTPSLLPPDDLKSILRTIEAHFDLSDSPEITLEANPGTVSSDYIHRLHAIGVNRISLGMQSAHVKELAMLERQHAYRDVVKAVEWVRSAGITNLNLDLIFGLPGQALNTWLASVEAALSLQPEHLSLYALTLEHGTPMKHKVESGILTEPDADLAADMYEAASERLEAAGFIQYEISNWARASKNGDLFSSRHNLQYWHTLPYIGVGAGAHGFVDHYRTVNVATPRGYINRMMREPKLSARTAKYPRTPATTQMHSINRETEIGEMMMMGLRLVKEGVSNRDFQARYQLSLEDRFAPQIERMISLGLLEWYGTMHENLRLTKKGYLLGNQVFREFI